MRAAASAGTSSLYESLKSNYLVNGSVWLMRAFRENNLAVTGWSRGGVTRRGSWLRREEGAKCLLASNCWGILAGNLLLWKTGFPRKKQQAEKCGTMVVLQCKYPRPGLLRVSLLCARGHKLITVNKLPCSRRLVHSVLVIATFRHIFQLKGANYWTILFILSVDNTQSRFVTAECV